MDNDASHYVEDRLNDLDARLSKLEGTAEPSGETSNTETPTETPAEESEGHVRTARTGRS